MVFRKATWLRMVGLASCNYAYKDPPTEREREQRERGREINHYDDTKSDQTMWIFFPGECLCS
jgi:hypothetical protein